ncbi:MAG: tripartite tricarboxylate transporter substrate binding protein [Pseudomonadota bacterium]
MKFHLRRAALLASLTSLPLLHLGPAQAAYPDKPIRFVVPFVAGSVTDQLARALGQSITEETKQPVVVDNKPGANAFLAAVDVARAPPDGYTVLITTNTSHAANEHLFKKLPYDPVKDFSPLTALGKGGLIMVVNPDFPARTVKEFIAVAKQKPGQISFGSGTSSSRLASEMFQKMAGIQMVNIPYKSNPPAINDLVGGQFQMMITDSSTGIAQVNAGKLRALAVSSKTRNALLPDVPTIDEAGVKGYELTYWFAAYGPAHMDPAVQNKLSQLLGRAQRSAVAAPIYKASGTEVYVTTPAELATFQAAESKKWAQLIKDAHIEKE